MKIILLSTAIVLALSTTSLAGAAYSEISCSTDPVFAENSCTQCFDGAKKEVGDNLGLLTDIWSNASSKPMYMLKAENELADAVKMISLNGAAWSYEPTKENFWEYTPALEKLTNNSGFYTLEAGKSVDWIQSKIGFSIKLNKSSDKGENIGLLKYLLNVHLEENDAPSLTTTAHSECVLFKGVEKKAAPTIPTVKKDTVITKDKEPKKLPKTGPQEVLLLLLSLLLAGGLFFISRKKA